MLIANEGRDGLLARAMGRDLKGKVSPLLYILGIVGAWLVTPWIGLIFFAGTAGLWLVPDRRIEKLIRSR